MLKKEFKRLTALSMAFVLAFSSFMLPEGMTETVYADPVEEEQEIEWHTITTDDWLVASYSSDDHIIELSGYIGNAVDIAIPATMTIGDETYSVFIGRLQREKTAEELADTDLYETECT